MHLSSEAAVYPPIGSRRTIPGHVRTPGHASAPWPTSSSPPFRRSPRRSPASSSTPAAWPSAPRKSPPASAPPKRGAPMPRCTGHSARSSALMRRRPTSRRRPCVPTATRSSVQIVRPPAWPSTLRPARAGRGARRRNAAAADGALGARRPRRAACGHTRRVGAAAAHARPPDPARQARPRAAALARLRRPAARRSRPAASHRRRRATASRRPAAPASHPGSTAWWAIVRYGKRGRTRAVPLDEDALEGMVAWVKSRPTAASERLLLSLRAAARPDGSTPATSRASSPVTPRRPTCPMTVAHRTCCVTPSARTSPTPAPTPQ
jgi:hypothetical protein